MAQAGGFHHSKPTVECFERMEVEALLDLDDSPGLQLQLPWAIRRQRFLKAPGFGRRSPRAGAGGGGRGPEKPKEGVEDLRWNKSWGF